MRRTITTLVLAGLILALAPSTARADATAFLGVSRTPVARTARGFSFGLGLVLIGFEIEYANTQEVPEKQAPSLRTGMINGLVQTPTRTQFYLTAGGGFFRERLGTVGETSVGTNVGGGVKLALVGPLRLRLDYRVFNLRGDAKYKTPQRFYAGINLGF